MSTAQNTAGKFHLSKDPFLGIIYQPFFKNLFEGQVTSVAVNILSQYLISLQLEESLHVQHSCPWCKYCYLLSGHRSNQQQPFMYQIDGGDPETLMLLLYLCGTRILVAFLCHTFYICPQGSLLISIFWYPKRVLWGYIHWSFPGHSDTSLIEATQANRESRHMYINLVKDWYLTQQCSQTDVKDCIISIPLIAGILFCAVLLYWLFCGLFCSFLERRILRTRTEKKAW